MNTKPSPQIAPALALVQLLQEHPELPTPSWRVDVNASALAGYLHDANATFDALSAWAHVLGGSIRPKPYDFESFGQRMRTHVLTTTWRDVRVELSVIVPLAVSDTYIGRIAEQTHQFEDPAVPPAYGVAA